MATDLPKIFDLYDKAADELRRGLEVDLSTCSMTDTEKKEYEETKHVMQNHFASLVTKMEGLKLEMDESGSTQAKCPDTPAKKAAVRPANLANTYTKAKRPSIPDVAAVQPQLPSSYCRTPISNVAPVLGGGGGGANSNGSGPEVKKDNTKPVATSKPMPRSVAVRPFSTFEPPMVSRKTFSRNNSDKKSSKTTSTRPSLSNRSTLPRTKEVEVEYTPGIELPGYDHNLVQQILDNIVEKSCLNVSFDDIAGQDTAKQALREMTVLPSLNPELFQGLLSPPKGLLLFGPPGNGKTLLAKAVAAKTDSTFLCMSASVLTSKWVGEGEKLVKALFAVARKLQPSVIFVDEVDSILRERKESEHEASRRLKTEFFIEMDGLMNDPNDRVITIGATNRPNDLDDAILRRFSKRIYVGLPDLSARISLLKRVMSQTRQTSDLNDEDYSKIAGMTEGFSGSDLTDLAKAAAICPVRELTEEEVKSVDPASIRAIGVKDFETALHSKTVRMTVTSQSLDSYQKWNEQFGVCAL